jgi:hypothetical protein
MSQVPAVGAGRTTGETNRGFNSGSHSGNGDSPNAKCTLELGGVMNAELAYDTRPIDWRTGGGRWYQEPDLLVHDVQGK